MSGDVRSRLRAVVLFVLYRCGLLRLWRVLHRRHVVILTVHGVMDADVPAAWVPLRPQLARRRLDECLTLLRRYYRFVPLPEAVEMLTGRRPVRPYTAVLTFDDGYRNNLKHALPILRAHAVPATFFLVPGHIERREPFWFDRLDFALQHAPVDGREVPMAGGVLRIRGGDRDALRDSYQRLRDASKAVARHDLDMLSEVEGLAASLEAEGGRRLADIFEDDDWSAVATWDDVRAAAVDGVTFGSHTVDHLRLGQVDDETGLDQLCRSKRMIEARTGQPCRHVCYPDGSVTPRAARLVRASGYDAAVTTVEGTNRPGDDVLLLRRVDLPSTGGPAETLARVSGLSVALHDLRERLSGRRPPGAGS